MTKTQVEVITSVQRRRRWSRAEKERIVAATMEPGAVASDPRAWLADVLARLPDHPARRIGELLPWNWKPQITIAAAA
jgi:IS66 C-terminal element